MKNDYIQPCILVAEMKPLRMICASSNPGSGWVEMGGYNANTGTGFQQEP